jgi:hypothetical protein
VWWCVFGRVGGARARQGVLWDEGRWDGYAVRRQGNRGTQKQTPGGTGGRGERCTAGDGGRVLHLRIKTFSGSHAYVTSAAMQTVAALDVDDIITTGRPYTLHRAVSPSSHLTQWLCG